MKNNKNHKKIRKGKRRNKIKLVENITPTEETKLCKTVATVIVNGLNFPIKIQRLSH